MVHRGFEECKLLPRIRTLTRLVSVYSKQSIFHSSLFLFFASFTPTIPYASSAFLFLLVSQSIFDLIRNIRHDIFSAPKDDADRIRSRRNILSVHCWLFQEERMPSSNCSNSRLHQRYPSSYKTTTLQLTCFHSEINTYHAGMLYELDQTLRCRWDSTTHDNDTQRNERHLPCHCTSVSIFV